MMVNLYTYCAITSPIGSVAVLASETAVIEVIIESGGACLQEQLLRKCPSVQQDVRGIAAEACGQLREYFQGKRKRFDLPLALEQNSPFSRAILLELSRVPFGATLSYGELAKQAGFPGRARAVGRVMAGNRIPLILPCHRIIGCSGQLTGYSGGEGVPTKRWLLDFESRTVEK